MGAVGQEWGWRDRKESVEGRRGCLGDMGSAEAIEG